VLRTRAGLGLRATTAAPRPVSSPAGPRSGAGAQEFAQEPGGSTAASQRRSSTKPGEKTPHSNNFTQLKCRIGNCIGISHTRRYQLVPLPENTPS